MSESDLLYVKSNMNSSESEDEENESNIWDDSKLNNAYDKAVNIANAEVAKRLAMSTNTSTKYGSKSKKPAPDPAPHKSQEIPKKDKAKWKAGMHCRAVYEEDGIEYEALVMRIINERECIVRFLGYENSEIVPINSLKNSRGKKERNRQIDEALGEECFSVHSHSVEEMECDLLHSPESWASSKKKKAKKNNRKPPNEFILPDLPSMHMPNFAHLKNIAAMDMPIPPPPVLNLMRQETECEDQAVSSMLLSWYMSGYYTGLYQGMKRAREGRKHQ